MMMMTIIMVTDLFFIWLGSDNSCGQTAAEPKASHSNILTAQCVVAQMLHKMLHMCCIVARLCNTRCTIFCTMLYNCCTNVHCPPFWISTALLHSQNHTTVPLARAVQCRAICWYCVGKAFSARCTALCCYLTLGGGIQVVDSTRKLNANILQQNQHNQREVFKMGLEKTQSCEGGFLREKKRECMSLYKKIHACLCIKCLLTFRCQLIGADQRTSILVPNSVPQLNLMQSQGSDARTTSILNQFFSSSDLN